MDIRHDELVERTAESLHIAREAMERIGLEVANRLGDTGKIAVAILAAKIFDKVYSYDPE